MTRAHRVKILPIKKFRTRETFDSRSFGDHRRWAEDFYPTYVSTHHLHCWPECSPMPDFEFVQAAGSRPATTTTEYFSSVLKPIYRMR